jgi:hypothetical protein
MEDYSETGQRPAESRQGHEAIKEVQSSVPAQNNEREASDERLQKAKATQREFVIRLYVTSASVIVILSLAIYLTIRLS